MAMTEKLNVDFSKERVDLVTEGTGLTLSQFSNSCVLGRFFAAFLEESQDLFDGILGMEKGRTLYDAVSSNLDALGLIVGESRNVYQYSDLNYMWSDRSAQGTDKIEVWVTNASLSNKIAPNDAMYRIRILGKILKNFTLAASVPEITMLVTNLYGYSISFVKKDAFTVDLMVPITISTTALSAITRFYDNKIVERDCYVSYPATLSVEDIIFAPSNFFCSDRMGGQQCDAGRVGIFSHQHIPGY